MKRELISLLEKMQDEVLELARYTGPKFEVAFDVTTVDSYVAGIVSKLLDGDGLLTVERDFLGHRLLDGTIWLGHDVSRMDLSQWPEILEHARLLERARACCRRIATR